MFNKLHRALTRTILFVKAMDLQNTVKLIQKLVRLYREFYIRVDLEPVITRWRVSFYYKDRYVSATSIEKLSGLAGLLSEIANAASVMNKYDIDNQERK